MHHVSKKQQAESEKSGSRTANLVADADQEHLRRDSSIFSREETGIAFLPVPPVVTSTAFGTIEAAVAPIDLQYFGFEMAALASGGPLARPIGDHRHGHAARIQAKDLVTELRDIGSQVSRMMAQVERAIDRFALHAG
jgi:hypothetical protein